VACYQERNNRTQAMPMVMQGPQSLLCVATLRLVVIPYVEHHRACNIDQCHVRLLSACSACD
jgi:hypothetical protein